MTKAVRLLRGGPGQLLLAASRYDGHAWSPEAETRDVSCLWLYTSSARPPA